MFGYKSDHFIGTLSKFWDLSREDVGEGRKFSLGVEEFKDYSSILQRGRIFSNQGRMMLNTELNELKILFIIGYKLSWNNIVRGFYLIVGI